MKAIFRKVLLFTIRGMSRFQILKRAELLSLVTRRIASFLLLPYTRTGVPPFIIQLGLVVTRSEKCNVLSGVVEQGVGNKSGGVDQIQANSREAK